MNIDSMSSAVQQAIYENNEGARLLRQCDYDAAVKSFTSVLQKLKPLAVIVEEKQQLADAAAARNSNTRHRSSSDYDCANMNASNPFNISFNQTKPTDGDAYDENDSSSIAHRVHTSSAPSRTSSSSLPSTSTSSLTTPEVPQQQRQRKQRRLKHFVFRDPVSIPTQHIAALSSAAVDGCDIDSEDPPPSSSSFYSPALFSKFLMIVMYNLALTLHLQALALVSSSIATATATVSSSSSSSSNNQQPPLPTHKSNNIKQLFQRSRKLYELAFELQLETDVDPVFTLALTNNLGLIYRTVKERKKCLICFRNMFSTMMYLMDSHQTNSQSYESASSSSSLHSSIKHWDRLLSNAMDILFKHTYEVVAAAA